MLMFYFCRILKSVAERMRLFSFEIDIATAVEAPVPARVAGTAPENGLCALALANVHVRLRALRTGIAGALRSSLCRGFLGWHVRIAS